MNMKDFPEAKSLPDSDDLKECYNTGFEAGYRAAYRMFIDKIADRIIEIYNKLKSTDLEDLYSIDDVRIIVERDMTELINLIKEVKHEQNVD